MYMYVSVVTLCEYDSGGENPHARSSIGFLYALAAQVIRNTGLCGRDCRSWHPHLIYAASHAADPRFFEHPRRS